MDIVEYQDELIKAFERVDGIEIIKGLNIIYDHWTSDSNIFVCGNGGSSSIASHFVNDLVKTADKLPAIKAYCLNDNIPLVTAISNDYDYKFVFSQMLDYYGRAGDLLICFSGSGLSLNIINAINIAKIKNVEVLSFTGFDGGHVKPISRNNIHIPCQDMMMCENIFTILCHFITMKLRYGESLYDKAGNEQLRLF